VIDPYTISGLSTLTSSVTSERLKNRETTLNESFPRILPQWIKMDKKVLKFNAYFVEHVVESAYENYRIRRCDIFYYLDDDTIHINEVKEENSGIPQGYFLKRHKIEKADGSGYVSYLDFNLKSDIVLYGKKFRICDCDEFTKKFFTRRRCSDCRRCSHDRQQSGDGSSTRTHQPSSTRHYAPAGTQHWPPVQPRSHPKRLDPAMAHEPRYQGVSFGR
jgi:hypothetical protein